MSESSHADEFEAREFLMRSPLASRLLRRRAAPLGVIDVRHAQRHYARLADWLAERLGLLESLNVRYRSGDASAHAGLAFVLADARGRGAGDLFGGTSSSMRGIAGLPTFVSTARLPPEPQSDTGTLRVRRAGPLPASSASAAASVPESHARRETSTATSHDLAHARTRSSMTIDDADSALPVHTHDAQRTDAGSSDAFVSSTEHEGGTMQTDDDHGASSRATARELNDDARAKSAGSTPLELGRAPRPLRGTSEDAGVAPSLNSERSGAAGSYGAGAGSSQSSASLQQSEGGRDTRASSSTQSQTPTTAEMPTSARERERTPLPLARAVKTNDSTDKANDSTATTRASLPSTSSEIPATAARAVAHEFVWHASSSAAPHDDGDVPHAGGDGSRFTRFAPARAAQATPVEEGEILTGASNSLRAARGRVVEEIDVEGLTERVSRLISRQLLVERERRGFKGR